MHAWDCSRCGTRNGPALPSCRKCGAPASAGRAIGYPPPFAQRPAGGPPAWGGHHAPPAAPASAAAFGCIVCGNPGVQKISALFRAGTWSAESTGVSVGYGHVSTGQNFTTLETAASSTHGSTHLARLLAPPARPSLRTGPTIWAWTLTWLIAVIGILVWVPSISDPSNQGSQWRAVVTIFGITILVCLLLSAVTLPRAFQERRANLIRWQHQVRCWDQLFYCGRCDHVYNPQSRQAAAAHSMGYLLR